MPEIIKTYTIRQTIREDGTSTLERTNHGFNGFELLGFCNLISIELVEQVKGTLKVDNVITNVILDEKK